jgi:hypothetical protein
VDYLNISNSVCFGAEWTSPSGRIHQLHNPVGTRIVKHHTRSTTGQWSTQLVADPERYGMPKTPPRTAPVFLSVAETFIKTHSDPDEDR